MGQSVDPILRTLEVGFKAGLFFGMPSMLDNLEV